MGYSPGKHAGPGPTADGPPVPEPSYAERARTLMYKERIGSLSTLSRKQPGWPFGSVMPYATDDAGRPIFLISTMAMHTQNLQADPRASLLVTQSSGADPLGSSRITLIGTAETIDDEQERADAREKYLARYANSRNWVDYEDFAFYRLGIVDVYYVGGFGVMGWVTADEYGKARPDPLADAADEIIRHMNADHADALVALAGKFADITGQSAVMTAVDRLGFHVRLETATGVRGARIGFLREAATAGDVRNILMEMLKQARAS